MFKNISFTGKTGLIILVIIATLVIISFIRHKVCCSREQKLLTPLGELVEVEGHNMSIYTGAMVIKRLCLCLALEPAHRYWILNHCIRV